MKNEKLRENFFKILPSIVSVIIGLIIGFYILLLTDAKDAASGMALILSGGFTDGPAGLGQVLYTATPIILTGLSVGFSFKTGLFNIGASGQFTVGAFTAILIGVKCTFLPGALHAAAAIIGGMLAGALWGLIAGMLKSFFKVSEVISGIMLNYTGMLLVNLMIKTFIYNQAYNRSESVADTAILSSSFLNKILPGCNINIGIFLAIAAVIAVKIILSKTTFGYELKVTGKNPFAGLYAGINDKKSVLSSMAISGALAGLGGALMYLSDFGDHIFVLENVLQQGFTGISVALLGISEPIGILIAGIFIAYITVGGNFLQLYGFTPDIVDMIIGAIIYCGALALPVKMLIGKISDRKKKKEKTKAELSGREAA